MAEWHLVGEETMVEDGHMTEVEVAGTRLLIARVEGQYYATQALCPHLRGRLARGQLDGHVVTCPAHGSRFDIRDGQNLEWTPRIPSLARRMAQAVIRPTGLTIYATRIEDAKLWVEAA
jgi:nitrite reductase/ring-hydroxylating ferredoxin subunit